MKKVIDSWTMGIHSSDWEISFRTNPESFLGLDILSAFQPGANAVALPAHEIDPDYETIRETLVKYFVASKMGFLDDKSALHVQTSANVMKPGTHIYMRGANGRTCGIAVTGDNVAAVDYKISGESWSVSDCSDFTRVDMSHDSLVASMVAALTPALNTTCK